jgi:hypothetical protein
MGRRNNGCPNFLGGTRIHHLFFADDSLLFYRANRREWRRVQEILADYELASGQKINREKTSIFFSRNTKQEVRGQGRSHLGAWGGLGPPSPKVLPKKKKKKKKKI